MTEWFVAAAGLLVALAPCGIVCARSAPLDRLAALQMASAIDVLILLLLAEGFNEDSFFDLALVLMVLSLAGGLVFIRFVERWV